MTRLALLLLASLLSDPPATQPAPATLTIDVADLRNARGELRVGVFDRDRGFPRSRDGAILWRSVAAGAAEKSMRIDLPPGRYAVVVLHDENSNKKLDTNFIGVPKEGYGVTNNPKPALRAATFKEALFRLPPQGKRMMVSIQYF